MKNLCRLFLLVLGMGVCVSCTSVSDDVVDARLKSGNLGADKSDDIKMVTVPFIVDYVGTYVYGPFGIPTDKCDINVFVDGVGTGTHVGQSMVHFDFCVTPYFTPEGQLDHGDYGDAYAYIVAANGDTLFVTLSGTVFPGRLEDHPDYVVSYWRDPFEIIGGTGRFEDASGGGMTNDYNSSEDSNSHHHWEGTITLKKGKR
ncbi:hypothetical protein [Maribellus sp. YY47]|uniref:hypothetical protein n=1 Tax=Maribellus sp. YY47 TaxID=2929486 RepID=UPI002000E711|nr:hypothetical protein [Maribellus sp. YY47]MCK3684180.1 hypothetical protein [Maribellus sp. YY47]